MRTAGIFIDSGARYQDVCDKEAAVSLARPARRRWRGVCSAANMEWSSSYVIVIPRERPETTPMGWNYPLVPQKRTPQNCRFYRAHANCSHDKQGVNKKWIMRQIDLSSRFRSVRWLWEKKPDKIKLISNISCATFECLKLNLKLGAYYVNINLKWTWEYYFAKPKN